MGTSLWWWLDIKRSARQPKITDLLLLDLAEIGLQVDGKPDAGLPGKAKQGYSCP